MASVKLLMSIVLLLLELSVGVGWGWGVSSTCTSVCFCFLFVGWLHLVFSFVRWLPVSLVWWWIGLGFCPSVAYPSCGGEWLPSREAITVLSVA